MCNDHLTLVQHIREDNGDKYVCVPVVGSWYKKQSIAISGDGAKPVNSCRARIPANKIPDDVLPNEGDFLVKGTIAAVVHGAQDFSAFDYMQITSVGNNKRGKNPHWVVSGS